MSLKKSEFEESDIEKFKVNDDIQIIPAKCFNRCYNLKNFDFTNIQTIGKDAFRESGIEDFKSNNIVNINVRAFYSCYNLVDVYINTNSLISLGNYAFALSNVENVTILNVCTLPYKCFYNCKYLKYLRCPKVNQIYDSAIKGCESLEYIKFNFRLSYSKKFLKGCKSLKIMDSPISNICKLYNNDLYPELKNIILKKNQKPIVDTNIEYNFIEYYGVDELKFNSCKVLYSPNTYCDYSNVRILITNR